MSSYRCHGITRSGSRCQRRCDNSGFCSAHPLKGGEVTKTGFAKLHGVDASMVSKWLREATIEETDDGTILWEEASSRIVEARDFTRPLQRQGEASELIELPSHITISEVDLAEYNARLLVARTLEQEEKARLRTMERMEEEGTLVNVYQVEAHFHDIFATLQQSLRSLPGSMVSVVRSAKSDREAYVALRDEIDDALRDLADSFADRYGVVEEDNT